MNKVEIENEIDLLKNEIEEIEEEISIYESQIDDLNGVLEIKSDRLSLLIGNLEKGFYDDDKVEILDGQISIFA